MMVPCLSCVEVIAFQINSIIFSPDTTYMYNTMHNVRVCHVILLESKILKYTVSNKNNSTSKTNHNQCILEHLKVHCIINTPTCNFICL